MINSSDQSKTKKSAQSYGRFFCFVGLQAERYTRSPKESIAIAIMLPQEPGKPFIWGTGKKRGFHRCENTFN